MSDIEKQKLFFNYKLPALAAVLVMSLIIVNAYNNKGQSDKLQAGNNKSTTQTEKSATTALQLNKQNGDLAALAKKVGEQEKESAELSSDISQMTANRKAASAALTYIERKLGKAKTRLEAIQDNISTKTSELSGLQNRTNALHRQITVTKNDFEQRQADQNEISKKSEASHKENQLRYETLLQEANTLEKVITGKADSKAASAALSYVERKLGKAKTKLGAIQDNISTKTTELSDLHKKSAESHRENQLRHETFSQEINTLEKAIASKTAVLDSLELLNRIHPVIEGSIQVMTQDAQKKEIAQQARLVALQGIIAEANANLVAQQEKFAAMGEELDTKVQALKVTKHIRADE